MKQVTKDKVVKLLEVTKSLALALALVQAEVTTELASCASGEELEDLAADQFFIGETKEFIDSATSNLELILN